MTAREDFWSRRRAAVLAEEQAREAAPSAQVEPADTRTDAEILAELDLPDPDTLAPGDDVAGFMARAVPDHLRRRALRRLWRLNPVLANIDGLVDYGDDYTSTPAPPGGIKTAYQVGRGMLEHLRVLALQSEAAEDPLPGTAVKPLAHDPDETVPAPDAVSDPERAEELAAASVAETEPAEDTPAAAPRRMRFEFQE